MLFCVKKELFSNQINTFRLYSRGKLNKGYSVGRKIGYRRVSSEEQNLDRQDLSFCDRVFEEKLSGGSTKRPELKKMLDFLWMGDEVHVWSIDRLARSMSDLLDILQAISEAGASLHFISENLKFSGSPDQDDAVATLQLHMLGAFAQFERSIIRKRQMEGIAKAKAAKKYKGRKPSVNREDVKRRLELKLPVSQVAREMQISRSTVYAIAKELGFQARPGMLAPEQIKRE
nr:recombinase family protein [Ruegeria arenilitoris]